MSNSLIQVLLAKARSNLEIVAVSPFLLKGLQINPRSIRFLLCKKFLNLVDLVELPCDLEIFSLGLAN